MQRSEKCLQASGGRRRRLSRRILFRALGASGTAFVLAACRGGGATTSEPASRIGGATRGDLPSRFASYQPAPEPNGDLSKVVWPAFITAAGPEVQRLYEFQVVNGELMRYMPCFCGCGNDGHKNNRDCYIKAVAADGAVVFDRMAPT